MSEDFEVKGLHEDALEPEEGGREFNNKLAVMTAIMATLGALHSYEASVSLGEAIILKNEASIRKTEASDQWNYYQAKSNKQNLAELATKLTTGKDREDSKNDVARYSVEKKEIQKRADDKEKQATEAEVRSEMYMHAHHRWATGTTALQIAISLAAMTLLTRRKWLFYASLTSAVVGVCFGVVAWFGY